MRFLRFGGRPASGAAVIGVLALGLYGAPAALAAPAPGPVVIPVPCSAGPLSYEIGHAPSGSTLALAPSCTYTLTSALPMISHTLTILGSNDEIRRAFFAPDFSLFSVSSGGDLTLTELTLTGGDSTAGGAIYNVNGTVHVINSYLAFNRATGSDGGGAIYSSVLGDGSVSVFDSTLTANLATDGDGGAIAADGPVFLTSDSFVGNAADDDGGAVYDQTVAVGPISGSAAAAVTTRVFSDGDAADLTVSGGSFNGNSAGDDGGAIATSGGLQVRNALLNSNHARDDGGAIYNHEPGTTRISGTQIANNSARHGGGIYNDDGTVRLFGSTVVNHNVPDNCEPAGSILGCFL
jgi:predicted outer membrane repeat protein